MGADGGVIVIGGDASMGWSFNTPGMYRGRVSPTTKPVTVTYRDVS